MTDSHMPEPHLTDEQLSWYLDGAPRLPAGAGHEAAAGGDDRVDGVGESDIRSHLAGCAPCRQRLGALEAARALVHTPVPPVPGAVLAAAVAGVLARLDDGADTGADTGADDLADAGSATESKPIVGPQRETAGSPRTPIVLPRRRLAPVGLAAAVVALLVAGVSVALVTEHGSSSPASRAASAPAAPLTTVPPGSQDAVGNANEFEFGTNGGYAHAEVGGDTVVLARLGSVSSVSALRSGVGRVLADSNAGGASAAGSGLAAPGVTPNGTSANSTHNGVQPSKSAAAAPTTSVTGSATTGTNKSTASGSSRSATQSNNRLARALQVCLASARRAAGGRTVEMGASSTYRTAAALVYVFTAATSASSPPAGGTIPAPAVVVVASQGCRVLVSTTL